MFFNTSIVVLDCASLHQQKSLYQALAIAAMCLQEEADTRPLMTDVVTALEFLAGPIEEENATLSSTGSIHHVNSFHIDSHFHLVGSAAVEGQK